MILLDKGKGDLSHLPSLLINLLERERQRGRTFIPLSRPSQRILESLSQDLIRFPSLLALSIAVSRCRRCRFHPDRGQAVMGEGPPKAKLMFIGEVPGAEEDRQGRPFVGPGGQLLTKMIQAIKLGREEVYVTHWIKCRPGENSAYPGGETAACLHYLQEEIRLVRPSILVALGEGPAQALTGTGQKISELRGRLFQKEGIRIVPTYPPEFLLQHPEFKRQAWEDLQQVRREYDALT